MAIYLPSPLSFKEKYARILAVTHTKTQVEIAELLDVRQSSISDASKRGNIPPDWYLKLYRKFGINPDWIDGISKQKFIPPSQVYEEDTGIYNKSNYINVYSTDISKKQFEYAAYPVCDRIEIPQFFNTKNIIVFYFRQNEICTCVKNNAYCGIDTTQKIYENKKIYAIFIEKSGVVLRGAQCIKSKSLLILHHPYDVSKNILIDYAFFEHFVIGKLSWSIHNYG